MDVFESPIKSGVIRKIENNNIEVLIYILLWLKRDIPYKWMKKN